MSDTCTQNAKILVEALPYFKPYAGQYLVVKYGGNAMGDSDAMYSFASDIVLLKQIGIHPIVVHGGGPQIGKMLEDLNITSDFVSGLRVTDKATMKVAEMVLSGGVNKAIVSAINEVGGRAIGLSGKDANLMEVSKVERTIRDEDSHIEKVVDLGFVGYPKIVNTEPLECLVSGDYIPVLSPVACDENHNTFNVNADTFAGAIASAMGAKRLLLLTDVQGLFDKDKALVSHLNVAEAKRLIKDGVVHGGMIPKLNTCIESIEAGLEGAVILDGRQPHSLILEILTEQGSGTLIRAI